MMMRKLLRSLGEVALVLPFLMVGLWFVVTQPLWQTDQVTTSVSVSSERLQAHVRKLSAELPPRTFPDNLNASAAYIREQWAAFGKVQDMPFVVEGGTYNNLSISFGPATPTRIVIGAHYDAYEELPGADDNASGIAGLLELARLLSQAPLTKQVELVAFTLEEPPYFRTANMGSAVHAKKLLENGDKVELMIALEMIGYYDDTPHSQDFPLPLMEYAYANQGNFIAVVGNLSSMGIVRDTKASMRRVMAMPVYSINAPWLIPGIDFSDHLNFWRQGFPALMVTDTAFYRNDAYHHREDTWERLDYIKMAEVVKGVFTVILDRTNALEP